MKNPMKKVFSKSSIVFVFFLILIFSLKFLLFVFNNIAIAKKLKILKFGTSTDLSASNSFLGKEMSSGIKLAFEKINREGGINGHQLKLIVLDDSYEPEKTLKNMLKLINTYKVLGIVGNVGTPTGVVAMEVAIKNRILFFAPLTGANALRPKPPSPYVYHYRASYYEELDVLLSNFLKCKKLTPLDIAFFTQNDAYGDEIYDAGIDILKKFGLKDEGKILHLRYPRNTLYVYSAAAKFLRIKPHPKAIVLGCSYNACIRFIKVLREYNYNGYFLGVSFVGTDALGKKAKEKPEIYKNILVANVTPLPTDSSYPIVKEYLQELKKVNKNPSFVSLEGYIVGKILIEALKNTKGVFTRKSIVKAFSNLGTFDIGLNTPLKFEKHTHQASHFVLVVTFKNGKILPVNWKRCEF